MECGELREPEDGFSGGIISFAGGMALPYGSDAGTDFFDIGFFPDKVGGAAFQRRDAIFVVRTQDVELALNGLYGQLMLKLQKREIHPETVAAMESFSKMIAYLAARYKQMEEEAENSKF